MIENTEVNTELNILKTTLKSCEESNSNLMREIVKLKDENRKLTMDLAKFTKGKEILDKLLRNQRSSNDKSGLGFERASKKKTEEEKGFSKKIHVKITIECIEKTFKNILRIEIFAKSNQANTSIHVSRKENKIFIKTGTHIFKKESLMAIFKIAFPYNDIQDLGLKKNE